LMIRKRLTLALMLRERREEEEREAKAAAAALVAKAKAEAAAAETAAANAKAAAAAAMRNLGSLASQSQSTRVVAVPLSVSDIRNNKAAYEAYMLAKGNKKVDMGPVCPGNSANYINFGQWFMAKDGFDMVVAVRGSNDAHIAFMPTKMQRSDDAWEVVIGGWGNTKSVIRAGTQGRELAHHDGASMGPNDKWRTIYISYYSESGILSVWNDVGSNADLPIMSAIVPMLSSKKIWPAFGAWDSAVEFTLSQWIEIERYNDWAGNSQTGNMNE